MPTSPPRICVRCGARLQPGRGCRTCRPAWATQPNTRPLPLSWPALRRKVLDRDRQRCQLCGARATHVDHITPRAAGGPDTLDNLRSLCDYCHSAVTGRFARAMRDRKRY